MTSENNKVVYFHITVPWSIFYVGIGDVKRAFSKSSRNRYWHEHVRRKGNYQVYIVQDNLTFAQAAELEKQLIDEIGLENLTNISKGGEHPAYGMKHSLISKLKISINNSNRRPENRKRLSQIMQGEGNPMFGRSHTAEARKSISLHRTGSKASQNTKNKMSAAHSGELNAAFNPTLRIFSYGGVELITTAFNLRKCFGLHQSAVSSIISGKRKSTGGWSYKGDYNGE